jgi:uncharacterized protein YfaS (alpha-2-macroglobulin family)
MRFFYVLVTLLVLGGVAHADDLTVDSQFIDTSNQNPTLCVAFPEPLLPGLSAHYEDYVRVDHFTGLVAQVSGNNLCIGGMPYEKHYTMTLLAGLPAQNGDKLPGDKELDFAPGDLPPLVAISGNGLYLAKRSASGLAITSVNVGKLAVHVLRLNDVNAIQDFSSALGSSNFDPAQQSFAGYSLASLVGGQAGLVWSGTMPVAKQADASVKTLFPIAAALGQSADVMAGKPGVYLVVAENAATAVPSGFWAGTLSSDAQSNAEQQNFATHWVIVTDLGLTAITGDDGLHVQVRSISSAAAASGVRLDLLSNGGDVLDSVTTDAGGAAVIPKALLAGRLANAPLAIAAYGADGDFSYLPLYAAAFDLSDRGVTGRAAPVTNDAFLAAERGIFRPGETVHAVVLLRDADGHALAGQNFSVTLTRPDTVVVGSVAGVTDDAGGAVVKIPLPANALHGQWTLAAQIDPTLPPIGSLKIDVQNFQPADMHLDAAGAPARAAAGQSFTLSAAGTYFYGAPAVLPVRASVTLTTDSDPVPGVTGYDFGLLNDKPADAESDLDAPPSADAQGKISFSATLPAPPATTAPLKAKIEIGYLEPAGNLVNAVQIVKLATTKILIGVKPKFANGAVDSAAPANFDIAAFDPVTGKPVAAGAQIRIVRTDTVYDWVGNAGSWTWHSYTVDHPVELGKLDLAAGAVTPFSRNLPDGDYTLIVADPVSGAATSVAFSVGWSGLGEAAATPDTLQLTADHAVLAPGGTAKVHLAASFAGVADVIVANNRVYSRQSVNVPKGGADVTVQASDAWNGGAYVIADLHRGSAGVPSHASVRAIGVGWIGLDPAPHVLGVTIDAPARILPRNSQIVTIKIANAAPGQKIHLVLDVVDEGILGLTNYKLPDPAGWFWGQRQLGVEIRDLYGALLNDQGEAGSITEGGDEGAGGPRVKLESTKLFSVASEDLTVGPDGIVKVPVSVPDFEGQARLTAIAWSASGAGSAQADMVVRDPVVMNPGLPNFLSTGDHALLPVTLSNVDGQAGAYDVAFEPGGGTAAVMLAKAAQATIKLPFIAGAPGDVTLRFHLTGNGLDITREFPLPVRAAHPPAFVTVFGAVKPGGRIALPAELAASGAPDGIAQLAMSAFPGLDKKFLLAALENDEAGGTDTVSAVSAAFPLLDPDTASQFKGGAAAAKAAVNAAITLTVNRQGIDGDIGDWSFDAGADGYDDWVTSYAVDFLLCAKQAGFDVPAAVLDRSNTWLRSEASTLAQVIAYQGNAYGGAAPAPFASFAYTQWLLARDGKANISALRVAADALVTAKAPDGFPLVFWGGAKTPANMAASGDLSKLSMALYAAGDADRAAAVLKLAAGTLTSPGQANWADGFWWTGNQDAAILLLAAATENDSTVFALAARHIDPAALVADEDDDAMAFLLRAVAVGNAQLASGPPAAFLVGRARVDVKVPGVALLDWDTVRHGGAIGMISGQGFYDLTAHYVPAAPALAFARGMTLKVTFADFDGHPLDLSKLRQGQDALVTISGTVPRAGNHLLQIVSLLPGCFSIEKSMPGPSDVPSFLHISDPESFASDIDRFVATVRLGRPQWISADDVTAEPTAMPLGQFLVAYTVKVTTAGSFTMPEVTVRDRLHPAIAAGSGSRIIMVGG